MTRALLTFVVPLLALAVPLLDTSLSILETFFVLSGWARESM